MPTGGGTQVQGNSLLAAVEVPKERTPVQPRLVPEKGRNAARGAGVLGTLDLDDLSAITAE